MSQPADHPSTFRLSPQQGFLLGSERPLVSQCAFLVEEGWSEAALRETLEDLVARHEVLRTSFPTPAGARAPIGQAVHDPGEPTWLSEPWDDALPEDRALGALLAREADAPFDLEHGSCIRVAHVALTGGENLVVLTAAAACADRHSLVALAHELSTGAGGAAPEPIQHADYAEWRAELIGGDDADAATGRAFWKEEIETADSPLPLLFGGQADLAGGAAEERFPAPLEGDALDELRLEATENGVSSAVFVEAAWHALLARLSGATDLLIAGLADGRTQPGLEGAIGPYEQAVPIRSRIEPETRFAEVLDQVRRARGLALRYQDYGSEVDLRRAAEHALAGFAAIELGSAPPILSLAGPLPACTIGLDWREDGRAELWVDPTVYERRDAEDMAKQLPTLLAAAVADPTQLVSRLPLLDAAARADMVALGAGPAADSTETCIHHDFERQAELTPELPAVAGAGATLTSGELNDRANRLAHHLLALGARREVPVGLCMTRSPAMLTALLGILKAGAPYLPLNFTHPPERTGHQLAEAEAEILVTEASLLDRLPLEAGLTVVCPDRHEGEIATRSGENPQPATQPADLAYVMYTSGSTGTPKGVGVSHRNLVSYTSAIADQLGAAEGMHYAVVSEISTDLGNTAVFPPLVTGGCIHLISPEVSMDGMALAGYVADHPIDVMKITPTHVRALLSGGEGFLPRRWLVIGGEALSWELVERIQLTGPGCRLLNHYGPTETTVGCCTFEVSGGPPQRATATVPIGRPLPGVRAQILDRHLEPVPAGVPGELCIGGTGVARGYVNRPEETAGRFVPDPSGSADSGSRMYRTGDKARFLRDGTIEFLGREDDQVKIRGFRVEPGEIEAAIRRHPAVREAAIATWENDDGDRTLVAYLVASPEPTSAELQAFLAQSLPEHMVPSRFLALAALPLTPSGKVDRQSLPDPATVHTERSAGYVAPRDELEEGIAAIWSQLLGVEEVGVLDDFFALGGHSLLATQAIMRIRRTYGELPLGALFNSPTVADLAEVIRVRAGDPPEARTG